jgi:ACS family tartrate transporter-like MFS transporter
MLGLAILVSIDRTNVSFAALEMNKAIGLTGKAFGVLSGLFYLGYFLTEVPSNIGMHHYGARIWLTRIFFSWGIVGAIMTFCQAANQFYVARFFLGVAEAGAIPGMLLYITYWFPTNERARAALLVTGTAPALSNIIGGPIATQIMTYIQWFDIPGWRWLFLIESIPAFFFCLLTVVWLSDRPDQAKWLTNEEKIWLHNKLESEKIANKVKQKTTMMEAWKEPKLWRIMAAFCFMIAGSTGIYFWLPQIIKSFSTLYSNVLVGYISMIPFTFAVVLSWTWARRADKTGEHQIATAMPLVVTAAGLVVAVMSDATVVKMTAITVSITGIYCSYGPFWALPQVFLSERAAAVGLAAVSAAGQLGGFFGPIAVGAVRDYTGNIMFGLIFVCGCFVAAALLIITMSKSDT